MRSGTPCVDPTVGAASLMAALGSSLGQVALTIFLFSIGTAMTLLLTILWGLERVVMTSLVGISPYRAHDASETLARASVRRVGPAG